MLAEEEDVLHRWFAHDVADRDQLTAEDMLRPELDRAGAVLTGSDSYDHAKGALGTRRFENPILVLAHRAGENDVCEGSTHRRPRRRARASHRRGADGKDVMPYGGTIQQPARQGAGAGDSCATVRDQPRPRDNPDHRRRHTIVQATQLRRHPGTSAA